MVKVAKIIFAIFGLLTSAGTPWVRADVGPGRAVGTLGSAVARLRLRITEVERRR